MQCLFDNILYDYMEQNGYYLVISKNDGFKMQDLDKIQVNMLQSNTVPRLLPMDIEERDFNLRLYYELGNRRALRSMARSRSPRLDEFLQMLLNILGSLEDSKNYMLNERNYLLDTEFIFIGKDYSDVFLTYVPVNGLKDKKTVYDELKNLVMEIGDLVAAPPGDSMQQLRDYFRNHKEAFSIASFKQTVIMLMNRTGLLQASAVEYQEQADPSAAKLAHQQAAAAQDNAVQQPSPSLAPAAPKASKPGRKAKKSGSPTNDSAPEPAELSERTRVITACGALFLIALIWKTYLDYPGEGAIYISLGLSILILDLVFVIFKIWKPGQVPSTESGMVQVQAAPVKNEKVKSEFKKEKKQKKDKKNKPAVAPVSVQPPQPSAAAEINEQEYYQNLKNKTSLLAESNSSKSNASEANISESSPTEIIKKNEAAVSEETELLTPRPYFETMRNGKVKIIEITGPRFIIGRKADAVDYAEEDKGISRVHLEVLQNADGWAVKDLESKNYSYKNGERLLPNQVYPISDGDRIKLATIEYTFKTRSR